MIPKVRVGTAGWSYRDWENIVYASKDRRNALARWAEFVDVLEINTTFYRPISASTAENWIRQTANHEGFRFTAKLYRGFTHESPSSWSKSTLEDYVAGLKPLVEAGLLGAVLVQFPWYFGATRRNGEHIQRIAEDFSQYPLVLEVRDSSWLRPGAFEVIKKLQFGFCNIDHPQSSSSIEMGSIVTSRVSYVRLHGRNSKAWFSPEATRDEKYNYLYSAEEVRSFLGNIEDIRQKAQDIYIITNNHFEGQAAVNALELKAALSGEKVSVPEQLLSRFPRLSAISRLAE